MSGRVLACVGIGVLALSCTAAPLAARGDRSHRAPQQLWRSFPLDPTRSQDASRAAASPTHAQRESRPLASAESSQTTLWLAVAAALVAALSAAAVFLTHRTGVLAGRLAEWRAPMPSAEPSRAWFRFVDRLRTVGALLREEVGSIAGPRVEFATPAGPDPGGGRREDDPRARRAAVNKLKEKRRTADREEVDLLKAKLTKTTRRRSVTPLRPRAPQLRAATQVGQRCRVEWWRGYIKSAFYAEEERSGTGGSIVAASPSFRWSKSAPPPATLPHVARAHAALVARLKAEGWEVSGHVGHWYALELQRRPDRVPGAERKQ